MRWAIRHALLVAPAYEAAGAFWRSLVMEMWWTRAKLRSKRTMGYDPRDVDAFLARIGAGFAAGIDGPVLADMIRAATFPLVSKGYEPKRIDEQLRTLAAQLGSAGHTDADVIAGFIAAA